jgi:DNA polymerase
MQSSLFDEQIPASDETLDDIYKDLLSQAKSIPTFSNEFFIFGDGKHSAEVVIVGESPGLPDADSERPFMGPVGDLLTKILLAIGLRREDCYLTNVVKYISRGEDITPDILNFFTPFLHREILAIRPKVIISLGQTPTKALLNIKKPISKIRGEFYDYNGIQLMPTFNPAYLLRDPTKKREVWEDMKKVREYLKK